MPGKRYWAAICKHGDLGFSTYASTREEFERLCSYSRHDGEDGSAVEVREISIDEFAAMVKMMPAWVKDAIKLRREAVRKVVRGTAKGMRPSEIPSATILGWRVRLTVDDLDGPAKFHLSARLLRGEAKEEDTVRLGQIFQILGALPLPELMAAEGALHFEWPAPDFEAEGAEAQKGGSAEAEKGLN